MSLKKKNKKAVILLSGGLDSSTCLAVACSEGFLCHTLAFDYGQRHRIELEMAARQARAFGVQNHQVVKVGLGLFGGSALTDQIEVPKEEPGEEIPVTYVPARNAIFLSLGLACAEVAGASDLFIGANQVDYSGYPDCRQEFLTAFETMANLATRSGSQGKKINIRAPLINLDKSQIIARGLALGVDYKNTHTCYDPARDGRSCGLCPGCRLRLRGFEQAGAEDPLGYVDRPD